MWRPAGGTEDVPCRKTGDILSVVTAEGNGDYRSASITVPQPGTYRWVVTYSGDALNASVGPTACGEGSETSVVSAPATAPAVHGLTGAGGLRRRSPPARDRRARPA